MSELKDIAGHVIEPGDTVVYPQMSGRSVQMMLGKLVSFDGKTAQIERTGGSRWDRNVSAERRYRDKRTGKGIDPYAASGKHYKVKPRSYYVHTETGEEISEEEFRNRYRLTWGGYLSNSERIERGKWQSKYDRGEWHDYVEEYSAPARPVTIQNVKNIVKVVLA